MYSTEEESFKKFSETCTERVKNNNSTTGSHQYSCIHPDGKYAQCKKLELCPKWKKKKSKEISRDGVAQHEAGAKLDSGKIQAGVLGDFGLALLAVAKVGTGGVHKYTRGGWQEVKEAVERYDDALWRHNLKRRYVKIDPDFGLPHIAHLAWNILAELELQIREELGFSDGEDNELTDRRLEEWMSKLTPEINELERIKKATK